MLIEYKVKFFKGEEWSLDKIFKAESMNGLQTLIDYYVKNNLNLFPIEFYYLILSEKDEVL